MVQKRISSFIQRSLCLVSVVFLLLTAMLSLVPERVYAAEDTYISPTLEIDIPTVTFTEILEDEGHLEVNWLGEYIAGIYVYLIGIGTIIAIVFIMIGGLQYSIAAGAGDTGKAKTRIKNAVTGLVLLLSVYLILWTVNPNLTFFSAIRLVEVQELGLDSDTSGDEGVHGNVSRGLCDEIVKTAKEEGACDIKQTVTSPTGGQASCGKHHWFDGGANGDWRKIKNLDYAASWDSVIKAPFDGVVTYQKQTNTSNRCGNRIYLTGSGDASGASITICHAKDFLNGSGEYKNGASIKQGDTIGHLGGNCCAGETPPSGWSAAEKGWCNKTGTACTDPEKSESCSCQPIEQAGNTSGPHVHMTWNSGGDLLACVEY